MTIGAGLDDFHRPATATSAVIHDLIQHTNADLKAIVEDAQNVITRNLSDTAVSISISTALMTLAVVLIAIWLASAFTRSITRIIRGISRFRSGERQFRFHSPDKDEIGALCDSFDRMADAVVSSVQGTLIITDINGVILYANDETLRLLNVKLSDLVGQPYTERTFFGADNPLAGLLSGKEAKIHYHEPTGRYYKGTAEEYKNEEGKTIGYIITTADVTDMVLEQKQIEEQRALLETVFTSSPDILWYKGPDGRYLAVNPRFESLARKDCGSIAGRTAYEVLPPEIAEVSEANERLAVNSCGPYRSEEIMIFADGHREVVDAVRTPVFDASGALVGVLGVARDVSARVAIERELRETQRNLKQAVEVATRANESKSGFLARMSHEIRTPMNAVLGMSNIARRKLGADEIPLDEVRCHVEQIEVSAQHLLGLLNEILEISKIEAGKIELISEVFDLRKLVNDVVSIIEPRCLEKNLTFETRMDDLPWTYFSSDALRLRQVLINILGNAIKFTPEQGQVLFSIAVLEVRKGEAQVQFSIKDSGIGIEPEVMANLFSPFEQGGTEITRRFGGTGLGLVISKNIVNLMGGDIQVQSEKDSGSTFSFSLWLQEAPTFEEHDHEQDYEVLRGKKVLLVDDVDINRMIVVEMLRDLDMSIEEAENGQEAVAAFSAHPEGYFDIILMDVQMPVMDGYEAADAIRAMARSDASTVPIVALTANSFKEDVQKALSHGMNAHLAKPLEFDRLMDTLLKVHSGFFAQLHMGL